MSRLRALSRVSRSSRGAPAGALSLVTQSVFVRAGENFILCVRVSGVTDPSQLELAVFTYSRIENRTNFLRTIEGKSLKATLGFERVPLQRVQVGVCGPGSFFLSVAPPPRRDAVASTRCGSSCAWPTTRPT